MRLVRTISVNVPELPRVPGLNYVVLIADTVDNNAEMIALFTEWDDASSFADKIAGSGDLSPDQSVVFMNIDSGHVGTNGWMLVT